MYFPCFHHIHMLFDVAVLEPHVLMCKTVTIDLNSTVEVKALIWRQSYNASENILIYISIILTHNTHKNSCLEI